MNIKLVSIPVDDVKKAFAFYTQKLGFYEHTYMLEHQLAIVTSKKDKVGPAIILEPTDDPQVQIYTKYIFDKNLPCILFDVEDVMAEYKRLKTLGVEMMNEPIKDDWGISVNVNDTCGNWIQLHQG